MGTENAKAPRWEEFGRIKEQKSMWLSIAGTGQKKGGAETKEVKKVNGDSKEAL